ncbi:MAG: hypothetical protein ABIX01_22260 [Chitinophagaceae bacterium]
MNLKIFLSIPVLLTCFYATAQDSSKTKKIEITSSFKPSLKPSAKINFNPIATGQDTVRPKLLYRVPVQNLTFNIYPASLKPAAIQPDTSLPYANSGYAKLGFGNFSTPYAAAAISFGDGKRQSGSLQGSYISSKGKMPYQQYSNWNIQGNGLFASGENSKVKLGAGIEQYSTHKYGYQPDTLKFTKDQLLQRFSTFNINAGFSNNVPNDFGLSYAPAMNLWLFTDNNDGKESHFQVVAPFAKGITDNIKFGVELQADLVKFTGKTYSSTNNLFSIIPSVTWGSDVFVLKAGVMPSWDNSKFNLLPDVEVEAHVPNQSFMAIAGWKGYYDVNSYRNLAAFNPWIGQPKNIFNTKNSEIYVGLKGNTGEHLSYMAKIGAVQRNNVALFLNDSSDGKTYRAELEPKVNSIKLQGELSYQMADKFYWNAGFKAQTFGGLTFHKEAYGLIPLEINSHLRARIFKDFYLTADLYYFEGNWYKTKAGTDKTKIALDLNAGLEFRVAKNVMLWLQFSNLLNTKYQRWQQYPVLGFQALGGVKVNF